MHSNRGNSLYCYVIYADSPIDCGDGVGVSTSICTADVLPVIMNPARSGITNSDYFSTNKHNNYLYNHYDIIFGGIICIVMLTLTMIFMLSYMIFVKLKSNYVSIEQYERIK